MLGALVLLTVQAIWSEPTPDALFAQRVNLALRQTAHELLKLEGNRQARIKPVQRLPEDTWLIPVEQNFNYDSLPGILHRALLLQNIRQDYNVAVLDCIKKDLALGYYSKTYLSGEEVPCGGRERVAGCYELSVSFLPPAASSSPLLGISWLLLLAGMGYGLYHFLQYKKAKTAPVAVVESAMELPGTTVSGVQWRFGQSVLDLSNQQLRVQHLAKDLTYREAKLLQFFCQHQNQLLERDQILKAVWEDEGILVGRSLDVFVSRLRKLLKEDETIKIVNVHGVGYRFEVKS